MPPPLPTAAAAAPASRSLAACAHCTELSLSLSLTANRKCAALNSQQLHVLMALIHLCCLCLCVRAACLRERQDQETGRLQNWSTGRLVDCKLVDQSTRRLTFRRLT